MQNYDQQRLLRFWGFTSEAFPNIFCLIMAISDYNPTEQQRLSYLAREYRQNGYDVHIYPDASSLPSTLTSFIIGLAAQKKEELIFAEVRTRDRLGLGGNRDLRAIAKCIEGIPNADWELVLTSKQIRF